MRSLFQSSLYKGYLTIGIGQHNIFQDNMFMTFSIVNFQQASYNS